MPDGGVSWWHSVGLETEGAAIHSLLVNNFSFLHQLTNELVDDTAAVYATYTVHTHDSITVRAFLLGIEMPMCSRVIFSSH